MTGYEAALQEEVDAAVRRREAIQALIVRAFALELGACCLLERRRF
jgi:hypothetical protein